MDIVYSLSNSAPFAHAADWARLANCWRTTGDIWDYWDQSDKDWRYSVSEIAFTQAAWTPYAGPGHWNDPDMLVVGHVGWEPQLHVTNWNKPACAAGETALAVRPRYPSPRAPPRR